MSAQALTLGTEDVAVNLNEVVDITSIDAGAEVEVRITIQDPASGDGQLPIIAQEVRLANGSTELQPLTESETFKVDIDHWWSLHVVVFDPLQVFDDKKIYYPIVILMRI